MFEQFDGTGRTPRRAQVEILKWLETNWDKSKVFGINAPTGVGKSAISRAIQLQFGSTAVLIPTNNLISQQIETYPEVNFLKGAANYKCNSDGVSSCAEMKLLGRKPCEGCPYQLSKKAALDGEDTIYNPISFYYATRSDKFTAPDIIVVDEAHKLKDMIMMLTECQFRKGRYGYPEIKNTLELVKWMEEIARTMQDAYKALLEGKDYTEAKAIARQMEHVRMTCNALKADEQNFVFYTKEASYRNKMDEYLVVAPIQPSKDLLNRVLCSTKIVLMSATLLESDFWDLGLRDYMIFDAGSPIPKAQRPVYYLPADFKMNWEAKPKEVAAWISKMLDKYPGRNTIIHVSYGWSLKLKPFLPNVMINTAETKDAVLALFKKNGGIWLASGAAEGIDLPDDECRLNIIPFVIMGNPSDPVIKKQLGLPNGQLRYELTALKQVVQQAGRSTRSETDHSITIIGDSKFPRLINANRKRVPKSFLEAIKFGA